MTKKLLVWISLLLTISQYSYSQIPSPTPTPFLNAKMKFKKNAIVIYNFNSIVQPDTIYQIHSKAGGDTITYKTVQKLWYGKRSTLQVKINPYLYDVIIGTRQVNDEGIVDSLYLRLFTSAINTINENRTFLDSAKKITKREDQSEPKNAESVNNTILDNISANSSDQKKITDRLTSNYVSSLDIADSVSSRTLTINSFNLAETATKNQLQDELKAIEKEKRSYENYKVKEENFHKEISSFYLTVKELQTIYDICEYGTLLCLQDKKANTEILRDVDDYIITERRGPIDTFINYLPSYLFYYKNRMDSVYENVQSSYILLSNSFFTPKYFDKVSLASDSALKAYSDSLSTKFNRINADAFSKTFTLLIRNLKNPESFTHVAPTILISKDSLIYTIETRPSTRFKPLIEKYGIKLYNSGKFDYPISIKGNFKINFSVGAAFMFNSLRPKEYYFNKPIENLPNDSSEVTILEKKSGSSFLPAIAAYAHGYLKLGGWFTPAITVGLSTNPTDFSNASYFAGLSIIYGQQNRLIFTLGRTGSSVNVLNPKYNTNEIYQKKNFINIQESDLVKKAFKAGWFFGVSYNVSSNR